MKNLKNWQINLLLFLGIAAAVSFIQYSLLQPVFKQGLTGDDLQLLFAYKTYGPHPPLNLSDALNIWKFRGAYTTSQVYYIGILESIFGMNDAAFHIVNAVIKTLATLVLFPVILIIIKRRLLALLATLIYAISYSSTGSLQLVVFGTEHLAIFLMFLFFVAYYYSFEKNKAYHSLNILTILVLPLLLFTSFMASPIRIYPLLLLIPVTEIILLFRTKFIKALLRSLLILTFLYLPIFVISLLGMEPTSRNLKAPFDLYDQIIFRGNWQIILSPFSGLGYLFVTNDFLRLLSVNTFNMILIYGLLSIVIAWVISEKPIRFFFLIFLTSLVIYGVLFVGGYPMKFFYQVSFGVYAFIVGIFTFFEWRERKKNVLLLALTGSIFYSFIFLWSIWFILGYALNFSGAIHRYLVISTAGASLFVAILLVFFYDKIKKFKSKSLGIISIIFIILFLAKFYQLSNKEIDKSFNSLLSSGANAEEQQIMQGKLIKGLGNNYNFSLRPILIYFDESDDLQNAAFYENTLNYRCPDCMWIHLARNSNFEGCIGIVYDEKKLKNLLTFEENQIKFVSDSLCIDHRYVDQGEIPSLFFTHESKAGEPKVLIYETGMRKILYDKENFYAFKLKNRDIINIKEEVLRKLKL